MKLVELTDEAHRAVRAEATSPFRQTARRLPNGNWAVPLSEDVVDALERARLPGETASDAVLRAVAINKGRIC